MLVHYKVCKSLRESRVYCATDKLRVRSRAYTLTMSLINAYIILCLGNRLLAYVPCVLMFITDYISHDSAVTAAKAGLSSGLHSGCGTYNAHCLYSSADSPSLLRHVFRKTHR